MRSHHSGSCGCMRKQKQSNALRRDIEPGTQFTYWTVVGRADVKTGRGSFWHVRCKCGTEKIVGAQSLLDGRSSSCGCRHKELTSELFLIDIVGEKRGMLTIVDGPVGKQGVELLWKAQCECGNTTVVSGHSFKRGQTTSCGCIRTSTGETLIASLLDNANIVYTKEYSFEDLRSNAGHKLRYDFAILDEDSNVTRLLEFDGAQHYKPVNVFGGEESFQKIQQNDHLKNEYAKTHNIPLVRIPYSKQSTLCLDDLCGEEFLVA